MACIKSISLYLALVSLLYNLALLSTHGQLLPVIDNQRKTYIARVVKPERAEHLSDEDLESWYKSFLPSTTLDSGAPRLVYSYHHAISGFAARLTPEEAKAMETKDGFLHARPEEMYQLQTTYTPYFLGLNLPFNGAWDDGTMLGEGIVIGVIDGGVDPDHPSFNASQMPPPPLKWKGNCDTAGFKCNNKIIGAKGFLNGTNPPPYDKDGHGTHVASTAAGVFVEDADVLTLALGTAAGMAPKAHLAIYKACFDEIGCGSADTLAAIDQAIKDGVDVISMSIGGGKNIRLYYDFVVQGLYGAFKKGISTCTAAGNSGPGMNTLGHSAPWVLTVGASSTDRRQQAIIQLGNFMKVQGQTAFQPHCFDSHCIGPSEFMPIKYPGRSWNSTLMHCLNGSLDHIDVRGRVVLCWAGKGGNIKKGEVVHAAGGAAMIIMNLPQQGSTVTADAHILPAVEVSYLDGEKIREYADNIYSTPYPIAAIKFKGTQFGFRPAPAVASFSSRGPSEMNGDIIKPDVLAPGVNILAAWPSALGPFPPYPPPFDKMTFNFNSGTSMATPHVSGIIALLKYKYGQWSPAAIQSAIITSARNSDLSRNAIMDEYSNSEADVYATGAGQVNAKDALDPGLIYDLNNDDYKGYLCGLGYSEIEIYRTIGESVQCPNPVPSPSQLNYPSIAISLSYDSTTHTVKRTVTNVGHAHEVYRARIKEPPGVNISLSTYQLTFTRLQQELNFEVTFSLNKSPGKVLISGGKIQWVSNKHVVTSPIAVRFS